MTTDTLASSALFVVALAGLAALLFVGGCTSVRTNDAVTVQQARVYVVIHPDVAAALVCWLDEPLSRCAAVREEEAR